MAEAVVSSVVEALISNLTSGPIQQFRGYMNVEEELGRLQQAVSRIQPVLLDAEERYTQSYEVKIWLGKLKDAFDDADDLVDDFSTEALRRELMHRGRSLKLVRIFLSKLAYGSKRLPKFKAVNKRIEKIASEGDRFQFNNRRPEMKERRVTLSSPSSREVEIIGREKEKSAIVDDLVKVDNIRDKANVSVISIVGSAGVGKTALAQFAYHHETVRKHFELRLWVCVTDSFDLKTIVEEIVESAAAAGDGERLENLGLSSLLVRVRIMIDGKRFLLVLDDVWNEDDEKWSSLKKLLMCGARGSKIVTTTRSNVVADIMRTVPMFVLEPLSFNDSLALFKKMAFGDGEERTSEALESIGQEIVQKYAGVPLAIRTIGSLLYFKNLEGDWLKFQQDELPKILQQENDISAILKLSYDHLPSHLKQCFAYCRLFPKDYEIDVQKLIKLWMGQGFLISSNKDQSLEDVGYMYFMDLFQRSFFQEVEKDEWGIVRSCKMPKILHDHAILVAGVVSCASNPNGDNLNDRVRHVSFDFNLDSSQQFVRRLLKAKRIQTFLLPSQSWLRNEEKFSKFTCRAIFSGCKCLRVLDLHDSGIKEVPSSLCKLKHLRYLDLSNNGIKKLPSSITSLLNLQTLKLSNCDVLKELPMDIKNLVRLRHLEIDGCDKLAQMPCGLGQLTSLQTLSLFVLRSQSVYRQSGKLSELKRLNNLSRGLEILHLEQLSDASTETKNANLKEKQSLRALTLRWYRQDDADVDVESDEKSLEGLQPHRNLKTLWVIGYGGMKFPSWLSSLVYLVKFTLCNCLKFQHLPPLDQLSFLKSLKLQRLHALEYITGSGGKDKFSSSAVSITFFPSLKELVLWDCPNLKGWWRDVPVGDDKSAVRTTQSSMTDHQQQYLLLPSFPCLSKLEIQFCPMLNSIPFYPHLDEQLVLSNAKLTLLQQTMWYMAASQGPTTVDMSVHSSTLPSSSLGPLSKLNSLTLTGIKELECLQDEWLQNLTSLERLSISGCPRLMFLSQGIQYLTSLKFMDIRDCEELDLSSDEGDGQRWKGLRNLCSLTIWGIPKLKTLPNGLQYVMPLEKLRILNCPNLIALEDWISSFTSLNRLVISKCRKLALLPHGMSSLKSLRRLVIDDCPMLLRRCQGETGEDLHKIKHIPEISERLTSRDFD
ncbi:disease resistance protein RGA2-like [Quercus robur]|uniref:disease resistance protein RGA2-like n=1 Tax=Quercus robur TaxID=38942 RepID=UPI002162E759|nr:disease resistance protein RGA2-like [Quercus robur]XP_050258195.1 disease resistance protein RGA2-like [Quercus robur]